MVRKFLLFLYIIFPVLCQSQKVEYSPKIEITLETYAFLKGQNAALQKVSREFPSLKSDVKAAEKIQSISFGSAQRNIEQFLKEELNEYHFRTIDNHFDSIINQQLEHPVGKEKYARDFLKLVTERSKNIFKTTHSKGILSFKYYHAPHQEIIDGYADLYDTKDHPKARAVSIKIPIPKSWLAEEAEMPETIQQFTSYNGKGTDKILILIYKIPTELNDLVLNENTIQSFLSPQSTLIRTEAVEIDHMPAFMMEAEEVVDHVRNTKIRMLQFLVIQKDKLYCLQGSVGPVVKEENLELHLKKYEPLFRLIASRTKLDN